MTLLLSCSAPLVADADPFIHSPGDSDVLFPHLAQSAQWIASSQQTIASSVYALGEQVMVSPYMSFLPFSKLAEAAAFSKDIMVSLPESVASWIQLTWIFVPCMFHIFANLMFPAIVGWLGQKLG
jgi:hypothetical protein